MFATYKIRIFLYFGKKYAMKKTTILFLLAAMIGCDNAATNDAAKTPKTDTTAKPTTATAKVEPPPPMDSATAMKRYMDCATPGSMHKMMASLNGKWTTEGRFWMDEKKPPTESKGSCENKMVLNGLYQESIHKSEMMGMPFEGHGTLAYDIGRKVFVNTWIDNMGSGIMVMEGTYDSTSKTLTLAGEAVDPVKGKTKMRQVFKMVDDKHQEMEMYGAGPDAKEYKWMEMKLTKN